MDELIWVGNTLYPRGLVITATAAIFLLPFASAGVATLICKGDCVMEVLFVVGVLMIVAACIIAILAW